MKMCPLIHIYLLLMMLVFNVEKSFSRDVGTMGETYTIIEADFLEFIQERVEMMQTNGQWKMVQTRIAKDTAYYRDRPKKVEGLARTTKPKKWLFDPSIVLDHDVITPSGNVMIQYDTRIK